MICDECLEFGTNNPILFNMMIEMFKKNQKDIMKTYHDNNHNLFTKKEEQESAKS